MYDFSIPGGGFVSFTDLVEVLGIAKQDGNEDFSEEVDAETSENDGDTDDEFAGEVQGIDAQDALTASEFVSNIVKVEFSDESLIQVAQIKDDVTALELKDQLGVEPDYSAELTEAGIAENLAQKFYAPDWVLVSLKPFDTEETLTITMKNGDVWTIRVTDAAQRKTITFAVSPSGWGAVRRDGTNNSTNSFTLTHTDSTTIILNPDQTTTYRSSWNVSNTNRFDYLFAGWTYNGHLYTNLVTGNNNCDLAVNPYVDDSVEDNSTLTAHFYPKSATVVLFDTEDGTSTRGTVSSNMYYFGSGEDDNAANVMPTATAADGFEFKGWYAGETLISVNATPTVAELNGLASGTLVEAVFEEETVQTSDEFFQKYYYTVNLTGVGNTIQLTSRDGAKNGDAAESVECVTNTTENEKPVNNGNSAYCADPIPGDGYRFVNWTNNGKVYADYVNSASLSQYAILPKGNYKNDPANVNYHETDTFVANFVANNDYLITLEATPGGRIKDGLTQVTYNEVINTAPDIFAIPDRGYRCVGWRNEDGQIVTTDRYLYSSDIERKDGVYTAVFEKIQDQNISYRANGTYGSVTVEHEVVHGDASPVGSVAVPKEGYQFISWVNEDGETVWPLAEFQPFSDLIYDGASYTAVFESASYSRYFMMQADDISHGYIKSDEYENNVNGKVVAMYIRDDGTIPAELKAVAYEDWLFDHWEVNGVTIDEIGDTIPAGYDFSGFELRDGWNVLIAHYVDNPNKETHKITYLANEGGTVSGNANKKEGNGYIDEWVGSDSSTVKGAKAIPSTNWKFMGWLEQLSDGSYKVVSNDENFVPTGDSLKNATYYAAFRRNESGKGMVGYNMNITDVPVKWNGVQDIVIASGSGAPMYYDTNNGNYFARGQKFSIDLTIPEADGYYFLGWYNKNRSKWTSTNANSDDGKLPVGKGGHPATTGDIVPRGSDTDMNGLKLTNIVFDMAGTGSRYTFESMFAGITASSKKVPYDGVSHELTGVAEILTGSVYDTDRYATQLNKLKADGGWRLDPVQYQLLDENGNPVGEPTSTFAKTLPGKYKVRVFANGEFAGEEFQLYKDITLEIYAAKVIIKKYWTNDNFSVRPDDLDVKVLKYDTKSKGAVTNVDTNTNARNQAKNRAIEVTASDLSGYDREEPEWEKHGSVWTKEYDNVLVRNRGYSETDQQSGYDLFFADETVPSGYNKTVESWVRSDKLDDSGFLTTTITFRNEYLYEPLTLTATKEWVDGNTTAGHPSVTFYLLRSVNGAPFEKLEGSEKVIAKGATGDALTVNWPNLPQKNDAGTEFYTYKIAEVALDGFDTEITGSAKDGYIVKNTDGRIDVPILKVDKGDGTTPLPNAEFTLYKMKGTQYQKYLTDAFPESPYATAADCVFTSNGDGRFTIIGLSDGDYWLDETKAPAGYITKGEKIYFTVSDGVVTLTDGAGIATYERLNPADTDNTLKIKNEAGVALPSTGGSGTRIFTILGSILVCFAGVMLIRRRRLI